MKTRKSEIAWGKGKDFMRDYTAVDLRLMVGAQGHYPVDPSITPLSTNPFSYDFYLMVHILIHISYHFAKEEEGKDRRRNGNEGLINPWKKKRILKREPFTRPRG